MMSNKHSLDVLYVFVAASISFLSIVLPKYVIDPVLNDYYSE